VKQIQATVFAFAAIVEDGSVVSWGHQGFGGNSSAVQDRLKRVKRLQVQPLLLSWKMTPLLPGAAENVAVIALQSKIS
jgi:hypothetical protein